jgi:hypothetical protein
MHLKGYSHALNHKKPVSAFSAKNGGVCFEVAYATKKLFPGYPSRHSLCTLKPPAASATMPTGHMDLIETKILHNNFFC